MTNADAARPDALSRDRTGGSVFDHGVDVSREPPHACGAGGELTDDVNAEG
jgi:hypothetical protein